MKMVLKNTPRNLVCEKKEKSDLGLIPICVRIENGLGTMFRL